MSWRDIVTNWLSHRHQGNLLELVRQLVQANRIPTTLIENSTLHSILLTQVLLETLNGLTVPPAPQANNFTYTRNAKEMMMWDLNTKNAEQIKHLEEQTGVNLDHYHKLRIENKWT